MIHRLNLFLIAGITAGMAALNTAAAETYRLPETGTPALVAEAPAGWAGKYTARDEMIIAPPDEGAILELSLISDPALVAKSLPDIAHDVLIGADLSPRWKSTEPDSIGGLPGQAFLVDIARDGVPVGLARLIIAKIDANHVARLTEIILPKETPAEQLAALKALVSHLSISGR